MKLHELVYVRNFLKEALNLASIKKTVDENVYSLTLVADQANEYFANKIKTIADEHLQIYHNSLKDLDKINSLIEEMNAEINQLTQKFFTKNYQNECLAEDIEFIRNVKKISLAEGSEQILLSRIFLHNSWKYPALQISCRDGEWTKHLIGFDPLYISDHFDEFLDSASNQFVPQYQARLRKYKINQFVIEGLPQNQFGFIFSHDYFNYLSLDTIKQYLIQSMAWLRPGGTMLFTYNNADLSASAGLCENYFMSYVPKSMLIPLAESLGFVVSACYDFLPSTSWIELQKPGVLKTVKAHQALGEIKYY